MSRENLINQLNMLRHATEDLESLYMRQILNTFGNDDRAAVRAILKERASSVAAVRYVYSYRKTHPTLAGAKRFVDEVAAEKAP